MKVLTKDTQLGNGGLEIPTSLSDSFHYQFKKCALG